MGNPQHHRAIWLSDIHLGTCGCKAEYLLDFLRANESDYLYLVGDIIDGWQLKRSWYWDQYHNDVIQKLLRKVRKGTVVVYIPGNHDEFAREYVGSVFGGITVRSRATHEMLDGRKLLVLHGDEFDGIIRHARWLAVLGDMAYHFALSLNHWLNRVRRRLGYPYWSLSVYLKHKVKDAARYIDNFEAVVAREAAQRGYAGIVCGHIHKAEIKQIDGVLYCNDGDWVESCTALVETREGRLEVVHWTDRHNTVTRIGTAHDRAAAA
ncbi:MAG: UDP-2,3-diacylglucosamine diphosphatase [Gammaproteobacteria bacterium]|jgi:UDP-2,3-diacylglucosamine pyrophosphatase LpxH